MVMIRFLMPVPVGIGRLPGFKIVTFVLGVMAEISKNGPLAFLEMKSPMETPDVSSDKTVVVPSQVHVPPGLINV